MVNGNPDFGTDDDTIQQIADLLEAHYQETYNPYMNDPGQGRERIEREAAQLAIQQGWGTATGMQTRVSPTDPQTGGAHTPASLLNAALAGEEGVEKVLDAQGNVIGGQLVPGGEGLTVFRQRGFQAGEEAPGYAEIAQAITGGLPDIQGGPFGGGDFGGDFGGGGFGDEGGDPGDGGLVGTGVRADMKEAFYLALRNAGMGRELIEDLWDWVEDELVDDPSFTAERALLGMYESEAFQTRFPAIHQMTDAGFGRRDIPTPGEYIDFEKDVANALSRVGVIKAGESFDNLITQLYENSVGLEEVNQRLNTAQRVMYEMPKAVRDKFDDWFGAEGESITMQTFLDPTDDWSQVQDQISTAQTGGWGRMIAGLDAGWDKTVAKQVSDLGLSQGEQWNRFARLKEQEMLFLETLDERTDLAYEDEGVRAAFSLEAEEEGGLSGYELSDLLSRRGQRRSARFGGGGGAMMLGTRTGFGAANA